MRGGEDACAAQLDEVCFSIRMSSGVEGCEECGLVGAFEGEGY